MMDGMDGNERFLILVFLTLFFALFSALFYYYKFYKRDVAISIVLYSMFMFCIVFFVSFEGKTGLGLGLLGLLSLIRLRSSLESLIDVGFIFYAISLGLLNAATPRGPDVVFIADLILTAVLLLANASFLFKKNLITTEVVFDEIFTEKLNDMKFLKIKIKEKYGIMPVSIKIIKIDYLKDSLLMEITYGNNEMV